VIAGGGLPVGVNGAGDQVVALPPRLGGEVAEAPASIRSLGLVCRPPVDLGFLLFDGLVSVILDRLDHVVQ
jgi:hypothetical protein